MGWILFFNTETFVLYGSTENDVLLGAGVIIIDKNDGSTTSLATHPVQELIGITIEELYKKEKYNIPIENEKERIAKWEEEHEISLKRDRDMQQKLIEEEKKKKSFFYKIFRAIKNYLDS